LEHLFGVRWYIPADSDDAEPRTMMKRKMAWKALLKLIPKSPGTGSVAIVGDVVHDNDTPITHLRKPKIEVVARCVIAFVAANVQKIHAAVGKGCACISERTRYELRKVAVELVMVRHEFSDFIMFASLCVLVTLPVIDCSAAAINSQLFYCLAEGAVQRAVLSAKLHKRRWAQDINQEQGDRNVLGPYRLSAPLWMGSDDGIVQGIKGHR
jgi:hypothetical protein